MRSFFALIAKDILIFRKDTFAVLLTFLVPLVMIVVFGLIFGGGGGGRDAIRIIGINHSAAPLAGRLMQAIDSSATLDVLHDYPSEGDSHVRIPFTDSIAATWVRTGKIPAALIIPADGLVDTSSGLKLTVMYDPRNDIETQMLEGALQQTIMTKTPGLFTSLMQHAATRYLGPDSGAAFNGAIAGAVSRYFNLPKDAVSRSFSDRMSDTSAATDNSSAGMSNFFANLIKIDRQQLVGEKITNPMVTRSIGGWAIMFALFSLTAAARSFLLEKEKGTLHRLLSTPTARSTILFSKFVYAWSLGVVQLTALFVFGAVIFSVDIVSNVGLLMVMIGLSAAAATAFGMVIASFVKTSEQVDGVGTIVILVMSAVGGSWFPVSLMPGFVQVASKFTLTYWSVEGFLQVLWRHASITQLAPYIGMLSAFAAVMIALSVWRFRAREAW